MNAPREQRVNRVLKIALFALIVLTAAASYPFWGLLNNPFNDGEFDRSVWLASNNLGEIENPRGPMAEDLRSRHLLGGMSKHEIHVLLGPSNNSRYDNKNTDRYFLGHWGYLAIDGDWLIIKYDKDGRLSSSEVFSD